MKAIRNFINWLSKSINAQDNKDWKVVALCIIAATTFWFFNALNKNDYNTIINYPIKFSYVNPNDSLITVNPPPEKIGIDVSGRGWVLFRKTFWFNFDPINIELPSPADTRFLTRASLLPIADQQLSDLKVNNVIEDTLFLQIENKVSKKMGIVIDSADLSLEENYHLNSTISIIPDSILVSGPSSIIASLPDQLNLTIEEEEIDENFEERISAMVLDGSLISYYPKDVEVKFNVAEFIRKSHSHNIDFISFPEEAGISVSDSSINVSYWLPKDRESEFKSADFRLFANFEMLNPTDSTIGLEISAPTDWIKDIQLNPKSISIVTNK